VLEGVLALVDEEHTLYGAAWTEAETYLGGWRGDSARAGEDEDEDAPMDSAGAATQARAIAALSTNATRGMQSVSQATRGPPSSTTPSTSPSKGKRGASPTELPHEDALGALSLAKRPSTKRRQARAVEDDGTDGYDGTDNASSSRYQESSQSGV
jgi:hypothetical protein